MKFYNLSTKRTYEKDGETKTIWLNVGTLRETDDGKKFIELNLFPDTTIYVFEKNTKTGTKPNQEINTNDIPF